VDRLNEWAAAHKASGLPSPQVLAARPARSLPNHARVYPQTEEPAMPDVSNIWYRSVKENVLEGKQKRSCRLSLWPRKSLFWCSVFPPAPPVLQSSENDESCSKEEIKMNFGFQKRVQRALLFAILFIVCARPFHPQQNKQGGQAYTLLPRGRSFFMFMTWDTTW
jgi:hypothetical protein